MIPDALAAPRAVEDLADQLTAGRIDIVAPGLADGGPDACLQQHFAEGLDDGVRAAVEAAIDVFEAGGAMIDRSVELPTTPAALPVYYLIAPSEASANLARYDGVKYGFSFTDGHSVDEEMSEPRGRGFGDEVKRRIMIGTYALSAGYYDAYYLRAQKVRTLLRRDFEKAGVTVTDPFA